MPRPVLDEAQIHPAVREHIAKRHADIIDEVRAAIAGHAVVVVGMGWNVPGARVRKALTAAGVAFQYLEYGNYLGQWRRRNALKMWTGWPTFPMVFVKGQLVGGEIDTLKLIASGELKRLLGQ